MLTTLKPATISIQRVGNSILKQWKVWVYPADENNCFVLSIQGFALECSVRREAVRQLKQRGYGVV